MEKHTHMDELTFPEFLALVREHIGENCASTAYWMRTYLNLDSKSKDHILKEMPFLAVRAVGYLHGGGK